MPENGGQDTTQLTLHEAMVTDDVCENCSGSGACDGCAGYGYLPPIGGGSGAGPDCDACSGDGLCVVCVGAGC